MIYHDLIIVGGGASGLICAIACKDFGIDVAIVEGTDRIGKKILTTGNGRCNITNANISNPFNTYHSNNNNFYSNALSEFTVSDTENFFLSLGLPLVELQGGKMYPKSLQASSVVDILKLSLEDRGIPLYTNCKVKDIHRDKKFILSTVNEEFNTFTCDKLVLACGGKSAIKTGSDGTGYTLAKSLGHSLTKTMPGIVQLKLDFPHLKPISGIKFDGYANLLVNNKVVRSEFGEILFTDYGISGPPILQISSAASLALSNKDKVTINVDMNPNQSYDELCDFLESHFAIFSHRPIIDALIGIVNKKLIPTLLKQAKISDLHMPCYALEWSDKKRLFDLLKKWEFKCTDTNGFNNAQVTVGGINTKEINPQTLESKLIHNLYFCGEILDVHGDCGGFNLQWAWSSGYAVAKNIVK